MLHDVWNHIQEHTYIFIFTRVPADIIIHTFRKFLLYVMCADALPTPRNYFSLYVMWTVQGFALRKFLPQAHRRWRKTTLVNCLLLTKSYATNIDFCTHDFEVIIAENWLSIAFADMQPSECPNRIQQDFFSWLKLNSADYGYYGCKSRITRKVSFDLTWVKIPKKNQKTKLYSRSTGYYTATSIDRLLLSSIPACVGIFGKPNIRFFSKTEYFPNIRYPYRIFILSV